MTEVHVTNEFHAWYEALDAGDSDRVFHVVSLLEARGPTLGAPYSRALEGTRYALRELRVQAGGRPLRVLYAFDPRRHAVLLLGGDKTGDARFYERMLPRAERLWEEYLTETG